MLKITAWGKSKPLLPAVIAQMIAITPKTILRYLSVVREFENIRNIPLPNSKLWLSFYLRKKHLQNTLFQNLIKNLVDEKLVKHFVDFASEIKKIPSEPKLNEQLKSQITKQYLKKKYSAFEQRFVDQFQNQEFMDLTSKLSSEAHPIFALTYNLNIKFIEDDIEDEKNPEIYSKDDDKLFTPEGLFFLKVVFPCWILYAEHHSYLLRKARQGDIESLEKILRLDKTLTGDRLINRQLMESISADPFKFDRITKAIASKPKEQSTLPRIKIFLAGFISVLSEFFGHKFTAPEIQSLFDAVAIDYGYDELRDPDLPDSPEAFSKAIQRERTFWQNHTS